MTDRYEKFANSGVREINGYNAMIDAMDGKDTENRQRCHKLSL